jgi:hypothetical protein
LTRITPLSLCPAVVKKKKKRSSFFVNMAAEVSSLVRLLSGYTDDRNVVSEPGGAKSTTLITRDLLGGGGGGGGDSVESESQELDLDLQVPSGWEKRLDLKVNWCSHLGSVCFLRKY